MNQIDATVTKIEQFQNISAITLEALGFEINMVALEIDENLQIGTPVHIQAKATNISLSHEINGQISISNQLLGVVDEVSNGEILCSVKIKIKESTIESIITQKSALKMDIKTGDTIVALIKASDISIASKSSYHE